MLQIFSVFETVKSSAEEKIQPSLKLFLHLTKKDNQSATLDNEHQ